MPTVSEPRFIIVEGPIGVGKTTLARRLADTFGCELLLEGAEENPFLKRFYQNPRDGALATQMFFLFQRAEQMQQLRQNDMFEPVRVADFMLEKDRLFARLTLNDDELNLYEQAYRHLTLDAPRPDLVIYLQAPVPVLMQRIAQRGREGEEYISTDYLQTVQDAYAGFFHSYEASPLLIVNAAEIDLAESDQDYIQLLEQIRATRSGRHFFNPIPSML